MRKILISIKNYLPGYKAGGPIRSIANLVERLGDEYVFRIITSDRDLGDRAPYPNIQSGVWQTVGKAQVLYLSVAQQSLRNLQRLLRDIEFDLIVLNSYYANMTMKTLALQRLHQLAQVPVIVSPRGDFSPGALEIKAYKKQPYLFAAKAVRLSCGVIWHAVSHTEAEDIRRVIPSPTIWIAENFSLPFAFAAHSQVPEKAPGKLRVVFLSRVSRKKNLDYALRVLQAVHGAVQFDIYGTLEDQGYWRECEELVTALPPQIRVRYCNEVEPALVPQIFSQYHLFLFPTRGENFGHVILESLASGCPVLLSDQTPWRGLEESRAGWNVPLDAPEQFEAILNRCVMMDQTEFNGWSAGANTLALEFQRNQAAAVQAYRHLFDTAQAAR